MRSYTITFKNGSTTLQSKAFNYGATPTYSGAKPTKAPSGDDTFVFTGWSPAITKVTGAKTYSAVFAKGTYDACGNAYRYVKIGNQTWLTENMRCNKYDTNSERAGATISTSTSAEQTYTPYYKLVSDKSLWSKYQLQHCADAMSDTQLTSAGYLYNWAAAVGVATVSDAQSDAAFGTPRQGICPNGWHIPIIEEFITLKDFVGTNSADKLRTVNGWCNDDYRYQDGLDTFGFAGLGAGYFSDEHEIVCFDMSYYWSASSEENRKDPYYAQALQLWTIYRNATIIKRYANVGEKYKGYSVRCMKGPQYTIKFVNYDGTVLQSLKVTESYTPSYTGATPTRARTAQYTYTFKGWDSTIGAATADKTYTATYTSTTNSYTIRFLNGTSVLQSRNMAYGITPTYTGSTPTKAATAEYSYTFSGWSPAIASVSKAQDYTAQFTESKRKYTIRFVNYDGTVLQSEDLEYGVTPTYKSSTPTRPDDVLCANYVFTGWSPSISSVTGSVTYKALFTGESKTYDAPENSHSIIKIPDICGNKYNVVKIGSQFWLAENIRCNKYDTESERAGAVIPQGSSNGLNPYFQAYPLAGSNATTYAGNLSESQIPYLGLFYSWAAAVGFATGTQAQAQTTGFDGDRQGICPNGWHIPVMEDWEELVNYIEVTDGKGEGTAGLHLKTTSGWYNDKNGTDTYGFSALPADRGTTTDTYGVGGWAKYWTPTAKSASSAYACQVKYGTDAFLYSADEAGVKSRDALCVRCVRAFEDFEIKFVNYDGTELQSSKVDFGSLPEYKGDTPVRDADAQYTYTFSGWDSEIKAVTDTKTYKAQFKKNLKPFNAPENEHSIDIVTDICGNKYNVVKIGSQLWLAENMRCNKYDTESEKAGNSFSTSASAIYAPYYTGCFTEGAIVTIAPNNTFTDEQWDYLGLLYNWAAALGLSEGESRAQTREFNTPRQGICPNGYHVPSDAEWLQLIDYIENTDGKGEGTAAKHLKATSGWAPNSNNGNGLDTYGFSLLPVDRGIGKTIYGIGTFAKFTTASAKSNTFADYMNVDGDALVIVGNVGYTSAKSHIYTVRCVREAEKFEIKFENYDGEELQSSEVEYGSIPVYEGNTPVKQASAQYSYVFSGWSPEVVMVTGAATYTAQYDNEVNKYVVRFLNDDGTELQSSELDYGATPAYTGETPTKEATAQYTYTFAGWDSEITEVTGAKDYTATYTPTTNKYVVRFLNEDGTELQSSELEYGATPIYDGDIPTKDATAKYTYTFAGWDSEIADVTGAKDYKATYTSTTNKYLITFKNYNGEELQSSEVEYGVTPTYSGEAPEKPADAENTYVFNGWSPEITTVKAAQTYTAQFRNTTNTYIIRFLNEDGTELQSEELEYGATPEYKGETPTKDATSQYTYTFAGWDSEIADVTGAKDYTATYTPSTNKYVVRFLNEDGTELQSEELAYGATPEYKGETPTKDATAQYTYTFKGWDAEIAEVTGAKDYTATYTPTTNKYLITFVNYNGEELQSGEVEYGVTPTYSGEAPEKPADAENTYVFTGWSPSIELVTKAQTYTAQFSSSVNKYVVRFLNEDGTELQSEELAYGTTPVYTGETPVKEATAQYTYTFNGWDSEIVAVTGAKDYKATYTSTTNKYLITFENYNGEELQSGEVEYGVTPSYTGEAPEKPADAENTYVFSGWSPSIESVTEAKTYTAQFSSTTNKYLIRFLNEDGTELQSEEFAYGATPAYTGETPTKPATAQYTYTFKGWDSEITEVTGAKDYRATYTSTTNKYLITFVNYDGTELQSSEVEYGVTPTYSGEAPEKPADAENTYTFTGWSPSIESVTKAQTYTAQFSSTANKYVVRFLNDDGSVLQSEELAYGATPAYTGETPTKEATAQYTYTFKGWDSEITTVTGAKDYTATYTSTTNKYLITFENYDGEELQSDEVEYGVTPTYSGEAPEKPADAENTYVFTGWSPELTSVTKAQIYTAQFSSTTNKYLVRFLNEDGTELQSSELEYGVTPAYTGETPTKEATAQYTYTFKGWDSEIVAVTGAKDYKATYTSTTNKYLITFVNYDGAELQSGEVEYGVTPAYSGEAPEKPADAENTYVFTGWSPSIELVTKAQTYTAQFSSTTNLYTIRFLNEDDTELQSEELAYGTTPVYTGETPTKDATAQYTYTFKGWDSEITAVTGAKDYKATYTSTTNKYLITFVNYDGTELQSGEVEYSQIPSYEGTTPEKPADAENTYIFTGWSPELTSVTKAQTYTAQFSSTTNLYTIRFLNEDDTELQSEELAFGAIPAYNGTTPTKDATAQYTYTFAGWDSEITAVTGAKDYRATYTSTTNKYLITFENYDGEELQSGEVEYGQTPSYEGTTPVKPADAESTYTFSGWSPNITAVTGAQTYTAVFTKVLNTYTVTAEVTGDGGTVSGGGTYSYGTEVTLTATPEHGYHVSKWSTGETSAEIKITVTEDMAFTVSFIHQTADNTPECANAPAVAKYDWLLMLNANAIKDMGYNLNENIVDWYRVVGEMDNLDSGERDDEKVGTGYYYTINSKLNDSGDYYALIDLPWQTTEVGCSGLMRTVVFHYAPKGTTKRAMAVSPTITYPEQQIEVVNLPKEEVEVYVYDVAGRLYRSFRTDGEPAAAFKAEPMAGTYIVVVWTSKGKETFKYIVRKR